jgi:MFS family permease
VNVPIIPASARLQGRSLRGLDWFNFFVANVQTGFGPFVAVYLTSEAWTQSEIGVALSIGTLTAIVSQLPGGALVDAIANKRATALAACLAIVASALILAVWPAKLPVWTAQVLHGFASCMLSPAIAAISLNLVGRTGLGERLGRNARYAAIGSGVAAAVMGLAGSYVSEASVFWLTAALMLPGLAALRAVRPPSRRIPPPSRPVPRAGERGVRQLLTDRHLLTFAACIVLFHLANAALLPLVAGEITRRSGSTASLVIAACIVVPQLIVAALSPAVGRGADRWGRRPMLLLCFLALPLRALLLALVTGPAAIIAVQALDGISAAGLGVLMPLIAADLTRGTNRFNLCLGALGLAAALGATLSTTLAGTLADTHGLTPALLTLATCGTAAILLVALAMPETRLARNAT